MAVEISLGGVLAGAGEMIFYPALSIRQPWPWAILHLGKDVENRMWRTYFRGWFLIHAGKQFDDDGFQYLKEKFGPERLPKSPDDFPRGGFVGAANLVNCVTEWPSDWFFGPYGFVLADAYGIEFREARGRQKFFEVPTWW